jgi:hypothetical protein
MHQKDENLKQLQFTDVRMHFIRNDEAVTVDEIER